MPSNHGKIPMERPYLPKYPISRITPTHINLINLGNSKAEKIPRVWKKQERKISLADYLGMFTKDCLSGKFKVMCPEINHPTSYYPSTHPIQRIIQGKKEGTV